MKYQLLRLSIVIFFSGHVRYVFTQELRQADSLERVLKTERDDVKKLRVFHQLSSLYWLHPEKALQYENSALDLAKKIGVKAEIAECYLSMGVMFGNMDDKVRAIQYLYQALQQFQALNNRYKSATALAYIGFAQFSLENYNESYEAYTKGLNLVNQADSVNSVTGAFCYIYLAKIFLIQRKFSKAEEYNSTGFKISKDINHIQLLANTYATSGDLILQRVPREKIGSNHKELLKQAKEYYLQALRAFQASGDIYAGAGDEYADLAYIDVQLNNLTEAQSYADSALLGARIINFKDNFKDAYWVQFQIDSAAGKFQTAFNTYKKYILYRDSILDDENEKRTLQTSLQYEFDRKQAVAKAQQDKKEAEAKRIRTQQYFTIAALGIVVLAIAVIAIIQFRNNKLKQKANHVLQLQKEKIESTLLELKSAQAQLIQSEKMASLGELTAGIAHEIQNPLNFVNNFSEVNQEMVDELQNELKSGNVDEAIVISNDIKDNSEKINHHGKRADAIVKGMLQHSRTSSGQRELTDINALADEYLRLSYHGLRAKDKSFNADINTEFDKNVGNINIVPQDIGRVLLNLINNAFYAVSEKKKQAANGYEPTVIITTVRDNGKIEVKVTDNGNGIPQKILDKVFQPFFTTKPTGQGTGLGLSLAYDIIKAHGGDIRVETKEGEGSKFIIQLPVV